MLMTTVHNNKIITFEEPSSPSVYLPPTSVYFPGSYIECGATIVYISFISHHPPVYLPWFLGIAEPRQKSPHYKEQVCVIAMSCARL